jgi:hypothetical protein
VAAFPPDPDPAQRPLWKRLLGAEG